jgi:hypothetical protein
MIRFIIFSSVDETRESAIASDVAESIMNRLARGLSESGWHCSPPVHGPSNSAEIVVTADGLSASCALNRMARWYLACEVGLPIFGADRRRVALQRYDGLRRDIQRVLQADAQIDATTDWLVEAEFYAQIEA